MGRHTLITPPPQHRANSRLIGQMGVAVVVVLALVGAFLWSGRTREAMSVDTPAPPAVSTTESPTVDTQTPDAATPDVSGDAQTDPLQQKIADSARNYVERRTPYVEGGKSPAKGFDSSGLVWQVLKDVGATEPYRTTGKLKRWATPIEFADLRPGDFVFYAHHVAIFVGDGQVVDASPMADTVIEHEMWLDPYPTFGQVPEK